MGSLGSNIEDLCYGHQQGKFMEGVRGVRGERVREVWTKLSETSGLLILQ